MSNQNIKQVRIFKESLPDLSIRNNFFGYRLRYRVVTNDKNNFSAWSPIYDISADGIVDVAQTQYDIFVNPVYSGGARSTTQVKLVWTPPIGLKFYSFDIFMKTNLDSDYIFYRTVNATSYDIIIPALSTNSVPITTAKFWVQLSTSDKKINSNLKMFPNFGIFDGNLDLTIANPTITQVSPTTGFTTGGTLVTITGSNFMPGVNVQIGGIDAITTTFVNSTSIQITTPTNSDITKAKTITVYNPDTKVVSSKDVFTYTTPV